MTWLMLNAVPLLNIVGLMLDIVGAFLVASEVVRQFRGRQYGASLSPMSGISMAPVETEEYKRWSHLHTRTMKAGLALLTLGFSLQLAANWMQLK